jgi:hypothetical protein
MKEQENLIPKQQDQESAKKAWIKPDFEIIDGNSVQSGKGSTGPEGVKSFFGGTYHIS